MNVQLSSPIMFATKYWGLPAFVKITPIGNKFDVYINDQHMALLSYQNNNQLVDEQERFEDTEMLDEISRRIEAFV